MNHRALEYLLVVLLVCGLPVRGIASDRHIRWPGPYAVTIAAVLDGDSVVVELDGDCPFGCREGLDGKQIITVRIAGIDAPEIHACRGDANASCAACPAELELGRRAKATVIDLTRPVEATRIIALSPDKYSGRVIGDLQVRRGDIWLSIADELLKGEMAVPYDGGRKSKPWCGDVR